MKMRDFPWPCSECGKLDVFSDILKDYKIKGVLIPKLHIVRCRSCGEIYFDSETDKQITQALL